MSFVLNYLRTAFSNLKSKNLDRFLVNFEISEKIDNLKTAVFGFVSENF